MRDPKHVAEALREALKALTDMAGLELTDWQRDYLTEAMKAHRAGRPVSVNAPRQHGRPFTNPGHGANRI